jgi:hypothetical protein
MLAVELSPEAIDFSDDVLQKIIHFQSLRCSGEVAAFNGMAKVSV